MLWKSMQVAHIVQLVQWKEKKIVVRHYQPKHSCLLRSIRIRKITSHVVANMFCETITFVSSIRPKHLKALVRRELGVFITDKVYRNVRRLVI